MSGRIQYEAWLMALGLAGGAWLMMAYDILRLLRMAVRHNSFWTGEEDFLYWLYAAGFTFMLLYEQNNGVFRAYVVAGVFLGMILYDRIVSRFLFRCLKKAGKCFRMIGNRLYSGRRKTSKEKEQVRDR